VEVGTEVRAPLKSRVVRGWVCGLDVDPPAGVEPVPLVSVRGHGPPERVVELTAWAAWRFAGARAFFLDTASSAKAVKELPEDLASISSTRLSGRDGRGGRDGQIAEALSGGTAVLRLPPGFDPFEVVEAAVRLAAGRASRSGVGSRQNPGVLVLAPSRAMAGHLALRLRRGGVPTALMPSDWAMSRAGGCVVVGTRSAAFAPLPRLFASVVLDAHDEAYYEEAAPTWCAWEVVAERSRRDGAPCVLVSAVPSLELLSAGRLVTLPRTLERRGWPPVEVVDMRASDPRSGIISSRLAALLSQRGAREGEPRPRVACVIDRKGIARLVACASCGEMARCASCGRPLVIEAGAPERLSCPRCVSSRPKSCPRCGSTRLKNLRPGVSRLREEIEALARVPVVEVFGKEGESADSRLGSAGGGDLADATVLVGTTALLHRIDWADAVAFLDFDGALARPRFVAFEEALGLLARAARLVSSSRVIGPRKSGLPATDHGRAPGRILVQTRQPDNEVVRAALLADPARLASYERPVREALALPPGGSFARISGPGAEEYARRLAKVVKERALAGVKLDGLPGGHWWLRARDPSLLADVLASARRPAGKLRVEVDPRSA